MSRGGGGGPAPFIYGAASSGQDGDACASPPGGSSLEAPRVAAQVADAAHRKWEIFLKKL